MGNVVDADGRFALDPRGVPAIVTGLKGRAGRFKVTPLNGAILVLVPTESDGWRTLFGGVLARPFDFEQGGESRAFDPAGLRPGEPYPGPLQPARQLRYRQRGGVVSQQVPRGEAYARGATADRLVGAIAELAGTRPITKFFINDLGHAFWRVDGVPRFIAAVEGTLEFPGL